MNAEITYCYNFWLMHENPSEIAVHMKRLSSKVVVPEKISVKVTTFSCREQFFSGYNVSLFHKNSDVHTLLNGCGIF